MKKKILSIMLTLVLLFTASACTPTSGSETNSGEKEEQNAAAEDNNEDGAEAAGENEEAAASGDEIEIRMAWWGDTLRHEVYNEICDRFEAANPDIKVVREPNSWNDYWDKLATQVAGGNAPDLLGMHPQFVSDYAGRGVLADIQGYVDDGTIQIDQISDSVVRSGEVNGVLYMVSQGVTFTNQLVNKTLIENYGGEAPGIEDDFTWDEFMSQGEAVVNAAKEAGETIYWCNDYISQFNTFRYMARQAGGDLYTEDGELDFTQETVEEWFAYWKEMRDMGLVPDGATSTEDGSAALEQKIFTQGSVCFTSAPANQLHLYQEQMPESVLSCARNPLGNDGSRGEYIEGAHFAIAESASDERKEAAAKLMDFFVNTEESMEIFKMEQGVPANNEMAEYIKDLLDETMTIEIDYVNAVMEVAGEGTYAPVGATEIDAAFGDAASAVRFDEMTPAEGAESFMNAARSVLGN